MEKKAVKSNGGSWGTGEQWTASLRSSTGIRNTLYNKLRKYMETNILHDHVTKCCIAMPYGRNGGGETGCANISERVLSICKLPTKRQW